MEISQIWRQKRRGGLFKPADTQIDSTTANQGASLHFIHLILDFHPLTVEGSDLELCAVISDLWLVSRPHSLCAASVNTANPAFTQQPHAHLAWSALMTRHYCRLPW